MWVTPPLCSFVGPALGGSPKAPIGFAEPLQSWLRGHKPSPGSPLVLKAEPSPTSPTLCHPWSLHPTKCQAGHFKLRQASFVLGFKGGNKTSLSFCFILLSTSVSLQKLATYLLINCTAKARPPSTPAPPSEALWERCLPVASLSTRGF